MTLNPVAISSVHLCVDDLAGIADHGKIGVVGDDEHLPAIVRFFHTLKPLDESVTVLLFLIGLKTIAWCRISPLSAGLIAAVLIASKANGIIGFLSQQLPARRTPRILHTPTAGSE